LKKLLLAFITVISLVTSSLALPSDVLTHTFYEKVVSPSIQILTAGGGYCSGTIIKEGTEFGLYKYTVLTARHCINPLINNYKISYVDDKNNEIILPAEVVDRSPDHDLAKLSFLSMLQLPTAEVALPEDRDKLFFGQDVISVSFPLGESQTISAGHLGRLMFSSFMSKNGEEYQRASITTSPGSSGSGLFAKIDDEWKVIGVLSSGKEEIEYLSLYVSLETINEYLTTKEIPNENFSSSSSNLKLDLPGSCFYR
jgi:S1-C subfamily serine protease